VVIPTYIDSDKVRKLASQYYRLRDLNASYDCWENSSKERELKGKLDDLANQERFNGGMLLNCGDGAERDRIFEILDQFGADSTYEYMYGGDDDLY
tara:strand:+ start:101 stop:388 length:288 start_codon:yes stop_codon:yes gene_type:complete